MWDAPKSSLHITLVIIIGVIIPFIPVKGHKCMLGFFWLLQRGDRWNVGSDKDSSTSPLSLDFVWGIR
jgi:hypothetical protein